MFNNLLKCLVLLSPFALTPSQAFWWRSTTTEAPSTPPTVMKQIPLTYFRTYTYQPMAANPLPFPLMSSTDYITNYAALANNPYFNPMMTMMSQTMNGAGGGGGGGIGGAVALAGTAVNNNELGTGGGGGARPSKSYAGVNVVRSLNNGHVTTPSTTTSSSSTTTTTTTTTPEPTTTTTSTTTSTTTTPAPTTTTTTSATTTTTSTENASVGNDLAASTAPLIKADAMVNIEAAYPAFNRKVYTNHFNINYNRPVYPYPEYSIYKPMNSQANGGLNEETNSAPPSAAPPNVEFVPCMCPVNIQAGYPTALPITGNPSNSIFLAQSRTNPDVEASSLELTADDVAESPSGLDVMQPEVPLTNFVEDLQMVNMDGDDGGAEEVVTQSIVAS